jgi:hypothetical protein
MIERDTWNSPTNEAKFVALEAKLTKNMIKELRKQIFETNNSKSSTGSKTATKKPTQKAKATGEDHPTICAVPKAGDKKLAEYKGRTWYWCGQDTGGKCEKWRAHDPMTCKGLAPADGTRRSPNTPDTSTGKKGKLDVKKLKVARAYAACKQIWRSALLPTTHLLPRKRPIDSLGGP